MGDRLVRTYYTFIQISTVYPPFKRLAVTYAYTHIGRIIYRMGIDSVRQGVQKCVRVCNSLQYVGIAWY